MDFLLEHGKLEVTKFTLGTHSTIYSGHRGLVLFGPGVAVPAFVLKSAMCLLGFTVPLHPLL